MEPSTPASVSTVTANLLIVSPSASKSSMHSMTSVDQPKKQTKLKPKKPKQHKAAKAEQSKHAYLRVRSEHARDAEGSERVSDAVIRNPETRPPAQILEVPIRQESPPVISAPNAQGRDSCSRPCQLG